jgi:DNA-binding NarL/FixJ family response regulator/phage shock protein PspC (stress-responsive transcriptional regulator)
VTEYRRAYRPADRRIVGGVATGLADHLGVPVLWVRVAFIVATWFQGVGVIAYLLLWRLLPLQTPELSPGLASATRRGLRSGRRAGPAEVAQTVALGAIGVGVLLLIQATGRGINDGLFGPLLIGVAGLALVWRQFDDVAWRRWMRQTSGWGFAARLHVGGVLVAVSMIYFVAGDEGWGAALNLAAALVVALLGLALILGPWIARLLGDLGEERRERVRSQERADVAAHLHDSVLQTLALLQKNAGDPAAVATLARRQERELRDWLYGNDEQPGDSLAAALRASAAEIEDVHQVPVELIAVRDRAGARRTRGHGQRRQARRRRSHRRLRRGARALRRGLRPRPRPRLRPRRDPGRPHGGPGLDHRPDRAPRRHRHDPQPARRRHGGRPERPPPPDGVDRRGRHLPRRAPPMTTLRVAIVDDHAMFRTGVRAEIDGPVTVVAEAEDVESAVAAITATTPDVVLLDVHMPGGGGLEVIRRLHLRHPETKFLALSVSDAAEDVIGIIRAGARGYVTKNISGPELLDAIDRVAAGDAVFSPRLAGFVLDAFAGTIEISQVDEDLDRLTEREREVMRLIARGYAYKEVAKELFISIKTVETHVSSVLRKLQLSSRHELTRWANDRRLI